MLDVGFDVDGVLADLGSVWLKHLNEIHNTGFTTNDITDWDMAKLIPESDREAFTSVALNVDTHGELKPYPGAVDTVEAVREFANVYVVTSHMYSVKTWVSDRDDWLYRNFNIRMSNTVHTHAKHLVAVDVLIDDKPSNVEAWAAAWPGRLGILWTQKYNETYELKAPNTMRLGSWEDLLMVLRTMSRLKQRGRIFTGV